VSVPIYLARKKKIIAKQYISKIAMGHVGIQRKPLGFGSIFTNTLTFDITNNQSNRKN